MESTTGLVVAVSGDIATVEVTSPIACRRCASGKGCGAGLLDTARPRTIDVRIPQNSNLTRGDAVTLVADSRQLLQAALFAYGLPLAGLLLSAGLATLLWPGVGDAAAAGFGLAGLAAGAATSRWWLGRNANTTCARFRPVVLRSAG
jgi:sigma-E factor negative regulatory protein RseC